MKPEKIYKVVIDAPLPAAFDYLPPNDNATVAPGSRVRVPFGRRRQVGVVVAVADHSSLPRDRLKRIDKVLDDTPIFDAELLKTILWAADYYRHPAGEVAAAALPRALRDGAPADERIEGLRLTDAGQSAQIQRAPRQVQLLDMLREHPEGVSLDSLRANAPALIAAARRMTEKGWVETFVETRDEPADFSATTVCSGPTLTGAQDEAVQAISASDGFEAFLLFGVTGSGKTEVYLRLIERCVRANQQALVLVPEIALTPQLITRFEKRFAAPIVTLHSGLPDGARLAGWRAARSGTAAIIIGTRSAVFCPLHNPGLIVVDEEHDSSFKQQEGFRYSGRDLAVLRAAALGVPIVLGSATPALESLHNVDRGRYTRLDLPHRPGAGRPPSIRLVDLRNEPAAQGLTPSLNMAMVRHLDNDGQIMLFLNRRGFSPAWFCSGCGHVADCQRCDAHLTYHQREHRLRCHHCGLEAAPDEQCPNCNHLYEPVGQGTERIEQILARQFPNVQIDRLDRDTTRRRGALEAVLGRMRERETNILVGTQMLTKGHHFPNVTLVGIINADQGLFSTDFRATERLAQMIVQVCGRAGRAEREGEVLIQTSYPEHPLLQCLIDDGYEAFAQQASRERESAGWPPYTHLALIRSRGRTADAALNFLAQVAQRARNLADRQPCTILGPAQAPMARRAGYFHAQLLFQAPSRSALNGLLVALGADMSEMAKTHKVRFSIDVDPNDLF